MSDFNCLNNLYHFSGVVGETGGLLLSRSLVCGLCTVCLGLFSLPLGVIGGLCSVIVGLPGQEYYTILIR